MLPLFSAPIKPFGCAVQISGHPARELSVISGLDGRVDPDFRLINIRMDRPIEPFSFIFFHWNRHAGPGDARSRWMAARMQLNRSPLIPSGVKADSRGDSQSVKSLNLWRHVWEDVAMGSAIGLRTDFDGAALRRLARKTTIANQSRRLLALAEIYDGGSRSDSARIGGVGLQIARDWVMRFNARGPDGLIDGKAPGKRPKLNDAQRQALVAIVESDPIPAIHGVVRWRLIDLAQWLYAEFKVSLDETTVGRELKKLGYVKLTARPRHHAQDTEALEAFKKGALQPNWKKFAHASRTALR